MLALGLAAALLAPVPGTIASEGRNVGALDGVVVWEAPQGRRAVLMRRVDGRVSRIPGVPSGTWSGDELDRGQFVALDVGLNGGGRVVATYRRCAKTCRGPFVVDVRSGGERRLALDVPRGCRAEGTSARWRALTAYAVTCERSNRTGVYVSGRRRVSLHASSVDLADAVLAGASRDGAWAASAAGPVCRTAVAPLPRGVDNVEVHATAGTVWWAFSTASDYGGNVTSYGSAAIGPGCAATPRPLPELDVLDDLDWANGTFAVDGNSVFVAGSGGVREAPLE